MKSIKSFNQDLEVIEVGQEGDRDLDSRQLSEAELIDNFVESIIFYYKDKIVLKGRKCFAMFVTNKQQVL